MKRCLLVLATISLACAPAIPPCGPTTCAGGCCDVRGVCVAGRSAQTCGENGAACASCSAGLQCISGACLAPAQDAGLDGGEADAGATPDAGRLRTVYVTRTEERLLADGGVTVTLDNPHLFGTRLYFERDEQWVEVLAETTSGTEMRFVEVPEGAYFVKRGNDFITSTRDHVDLGARTVGHRQTQLGPGTMVTVALSNVDPAFRGGDLIGLGSLNAGAYTDSVLVNGRPDASVGQVTFDFAASSPAPFALGPGDDATVLFRRNGSSGGVTVRETIGAANVAPVTLMPARPVTIQAPLSAPARESLAVSVRLSDFSQFVADVSATATPTLGVASVSAIPTTRLATGAPFEGRSPILVELQPTTAMSDFATTATFGNPFSLPGRVVEARLLATVQHTLSGRTLSKPYDVMGSARTDGGVIAPELSPVRFLRLNGELANQARTGVGLTPRLEWSQPTIGRANSFVIVIFKLTPQGTTLTDTIVSRLIGSSTGLRLPPGVLQEGEAYYLLVNAFTATSFDPGEHPLWNDLDRGRAATVSAPFTP